MDMVQELGAVSADIILFLAALHAFFRLFKDHRAPSVGFLLITVSSALTLLPLPGTAVSLAQKDLRWAGEALCPALLGFGFLWFSEDHLTACVLLIGSSVLPTLADWLSEDVLVIMTRCQALSALSCSLTVCLFAANGTGVLVSVALSLPALVAPRAVGSSAASLGASQTVGGLLEWVLKVVMAAGCWTTQRALDTFLQDLKQWDTDVG
ncbi:uncharacterized protein LOC134310248 [Trichomycterus rosablanca]|uniref:uncharacterized protein LOC134310248 n=1 Tax=Trichomycterus rosablanca TaxID=2290929 RepID=UPI002F354270